MDTAGSSYACKSGEMSFSQYLSAGEPGTKEEWAGQKTRSLIQKLQVHVKLLLFLNQHLVALKSALGLR